MQEKFIQEIVKDLIAIDPELQETKVQLEKLVKDLIQNKPKSPFTQEFKDSLKAQIIWAINDQKIVNEDKKRNWQDMFQSIKFWMIGFSTMATGLLIIAVFQYFQWITSPDNNIISSNEILAISNTDQKETNTQKTKESEIIQESNLDYNNGDIVAYSVQNDSTDSAWNQELMMARTMSFEDDYEIDIAQFTMDSYEEGFLAGKELGLEVANDITLASTKNLCKISEKFINSNDINENTSRTLYFEWEIYQADIDFHKNSINIKRIGTQADNTNTNNIPNLNLFFETNWFQLDIENFRKQTTDLEDIIEYISVWNREITVEIDTTNNNIISIKNICIYD